MIQMIAVGDKRIITPGAVRNIHIHADNSAMVYFVGASCMPLKPVDGPDFCNSILANPIFVGCDFPDDSHRIVHLSFVSQVAMNEKGETRVYFTDGTILSFIKANESRIVFEAIESRMEMFNRAHQLAQGAQANREKRTEAGLYIP